MTMRAPGRWAAALLLACAAGPAAGAPSEESSPTVDADYVAGRKAIDGRNWAEAVKLLGRAAARDGSNADIQNLLGFAERNLGHLDAAFDHYEKALRLNPKHRGAHEYVGETYLLAGKLPQAEEHLAALEKICGRSCEEYQDLAKSIAAYREKQAAPAK